jgi:uncharacterized protein Smg (DUF494 family)
MNNSVVEIISLLIQRMLNDNEQVVDEEETVQELIELGYKIQDIDQAFELIYNTTDIIEAEKIPLENQQVVTPYNRIFSVGERLFLPLKMQGLIRKLMNLNLLTPEENEQVIMMALQTSYNGSVATSDFWDILEEVILDENKLGLISAEIPELNNIITGNYKYIN